MLASQAYPAAGRHGAVAGRGRNCRMKKAPETPGALAWLGARPAYLDRSAHSALPQERTGLPVQADGVVHESRMEKVEEFEGDGGAGVSELVLAGAWEARCGCPGPAHSELQIHACPLCMKCNTPSSKNMVDRLMELGIRTASARGWEDRGRTMVGFGAAGLGRFPDRGFGRRSLSESRFRRRQPA